MNTQILNKIKGLKAYYYNGYRLIAEVADVYDVGIDDMKSLIKDLGISITFRSYNPIDLQKLYRYVSKDTVNFIDKYTKKVYVKELPAEDLKEIYYNTGAIITKDPVLRSQVAKDIEKMYRENREDIEQFRRNHGNNVNRLSSTENKWILFTCLGGASEVGRSAYLIRTPESSILMECGVKPIEGLVQYPYLNMPELDIKKLDAVIITHTHVDHCLFLPALYQAGYTGPVFMTGATQKLVTATHLDYYNLQQVGFPIYSIDDVRMWIKKCYPIDFNKWIKLAPNIYMLFTPSGHIFGGAMVQLKIFDKNILFTGDYKYRQDKTLPPINVSNFAVDYLISEGTYLNSDRPNTSEESLIMYLIKLLRELKLKNNFILIPVLSVGRGQDLLYYFDMLFKLYPFLACTVHIDGCLHEVTNIFSDDADFLHKNLKESIKNGDNPFYNPNFNYVKDRSKVLEIPGIIITTSGMFEGGPVLHYLKQLCEYESNRIVIVTAQLNELGKSIKNREKIIKYFINGVPHVSHLRAKVDVLSYFSGHASEDDIYKFITKTDAEQTYIVHTDRKNALEFIRKRNLKKVKVPKNLETYRFY